MKSYKLQVTSYKKEISSKFKVQSTYYLILKTHYLLLITFCFLLLTGCKTNTVYVPVETVKTEYKDKVSRDSVRLYDSVFVLIKGDTVRLEKYKYLYRDKLTRDSIFGSDTIRVPYPVVETKEVNRLTGWQSFQLWCGRILLLLLIGWIGWKKMKKVTSY